jgi:hypothetical protein
MSLLVAAALALLAVTSPETAGQAPKPKKPSLSLRATPNVGFTPARISFVAELKGGSNDYEDFYCATVEWDWGDGTESEESIDCDPYSAGKSEIQRRFAKDHQYQIADEYRVQFRLKKGSKVVGAASTMIRLRPGLRDGFGDISR